MWKSLLFSALLTTLILGGWLIIDRRARAGQAFRAVKLARTAQLGGTLIYLAEELDYFKKHGLKVELISFESGAMAIEALKQKKVDYAIASDTALIPSLLAGVNIQIIASTAMSTGSIGLVVNKDRITSEGDLKGKRIGTVEGSGGDFYFRALLMKYRIPNSELRLSYQTPKELERSLRSGALDGVCIWKPLLLDFQKILGEKGVAYISRSINTSTWNIVARAGADSEIHEDLIRALIDAEVALVEDESAAIPTIVRYSNTSRESIKSLLKLTRFGVLLDQSLLVSIENQMEWLSSNDGEGRRQPLPNVLEYINMGPLLAVDSGRVGIIH